MDFSLFLDFVGLVASLIFLWWAGSLSVDYSVRIADVFNLNRLFIGFVLISVSTGFPELSIALSSALRGVQDISAGDILGSNVCDVSLVLGLAILLYGTLKISKKEAKDSLVLLLIIAVSMAAIFLLGTLNWVAGIVFILIYFVSIGWLWLTTTKKEGLEEEKAQEKIKAKDLLLDVKSGRGQRQKAGRISRKEKILVIVKLSGALLLVLGASELAVRFALEVTSKLALSLKTIGATIFAVGTSLPEISLSLNAMQKKEYSLALGNSLGSVLEQGTLLIGILALISDKPIDTASLRSLAPFMFFSFFIIGFSIIKRKKIGRVEAILMLVSFMMFLLYQIFWIG
ncbi:MAG: sodium:calcium antiporter [bacterium]